MRKTEKASFVVLQSGTDDGYYKCEEMPFFEIGSVHYEEYLVNIRLPAVKTNEKIGPVADIHFVVSYINKLQSIYQLAVTKIQVAEYIQLVHREFNS